MQNLIQKLRQSSIVFENSDLFSEKNENFDELQRPQSLKLHMFPTEQCLQKSFSFRSRVISKKLKKIWFLHIHSMDVILRRTDNYSSFIIIIIIISIY